MSQALKIEFDLAQIEAVKRAVIGAGGSAGKVMARAVNKTLEGVRTDATSEIGRILNIKSSRIREDFKIARASEKNMTARIDSKGKPVGLMSFSGTRQIKKGVSVKVRKDRGRKILYHAFIADAKGAKNVFSRMYRGARAKVRPGFAYGRLARLYRFPIERLTGPRIQDIYDDPPVIGAVMKKADGRLSVNLDREMNYELSKLK